MRLRRTVHCQQCQIANVLQWHVNVFAHLGIDSNLLDEIVVKIGRVGVKDTEPSQVWDGGELSEKVGQAATVFGTDVLAPLVGVFCNKVELKCALAYQSAGFVYYGVPWFGTELASAIYIYI